MITGATNYFRGKWKDKFHEEPSIEKLDVLLETKSIQVQSFALYYNGKKKSLESVLAIFWIPEDGLVFKVDPSSRSLVTFYCNQDLFGIDQKKLDEEDANLTK